MVTILVTAIKQDAEKTLGDIEHMVRDAVINDPVVIYRESFPACAELIKQGGVDGVITNLGHASATAVRNMEARLGEKLPIPCYNSHDHGQNQFDLSDSIKEWLNENFGFR